MDSDYACIASGKSRGISRSGVSLKVRRDVRKAAIFSLELTMKMLVFHFRLAGGLQMRATVSLEWTCPCDDSERRIAGDPERDSLWSLHFPTEAPLRELRCSNRVVKPRHSCCLGP